MRIRSIRPEFWSSEDIAALPWDYRLIFIGLWSYVDDNGVGRDVPRLIAADLFPLDEDLRGALKKIQGALTEYSNRGLITRYEVDGKPYLHVTTFGTHQIINRPSRGRYPLPTSTDAVPHDALTESSVSPPANEVIGEGEKGRRGEEELLLDAHASKESETIFDEFWGKYPRKVAKRKAETAWKSAIKRADASVILAGLARFKFSEDQQYIPHPSAWLNADRWADQVGPQLSIVGGQQTWSASELDAILGPDMWRCPQPPQAEITAGTAWEWQQQVKAKHRADRIAQAASKLGISA